MAGVFVLVQNEFLREEPAGGACYLYHVHAGCKQTQVNACGIGSGCSVHFFAVDVANDVCAVCIER